LLTTKSKLPKIPPGFLKCRYPVIAKGAAGNFLGAEPGARDCTTTQNYSVSYTY
jgi:hypothetical protein